MVGEKNHAEQNSGKNESLINDFVSEKEWQGVDSEKREKLRNGLGEDEIAQHLESLEGSVMNKSALTLRLREKWRGLSQEEKREIAVRDLILDKLISRDGN